MIKTRDEFDNMTLYEMRDCYEEGSKNHACLDKAIKFRAKLGLDHLTNKQFIDYCSRNKEFIREEITELFPGAHIFKSIAGKGTDVMW